MTRLIMKTSSDSKANVFFYTMILHNGNDMGKRKPTLLPLSPLLTLHYIQYLNMMVCDNNQIPWNMEENVDHSLVLSPHKHVSFPENSFSLWLGLNLPSPLWRSKKKKKRNRRRRGSRRKKWSEKGGKGQKEENKYVKALGTRRFCRFLKKSFWPVLCRRLYLLLQKMRLNRESPLLDLYLALKYLAQQQSRFCIFLLPQISLSFHSLPVL